MNELYSDEEIYKMIIEDEEIDTDYNYLDEEVEF